MGLSDYKVGPVMASADMQRSRDFYERQLGLSPSEESEDFVSYLCAEGTGLSVYLSPEHAGKSTATLAGWAVEGLEEVVEDLSSRGVTFEQYDQPGIKTDERGIAQPEGDDGFKVAWVRDPDGNTIALNEM